MYEIMLAAVLWGSRVEPSRSHHLSTRGWLHKKNRGQSESKLNRQLGEFTDSERCYFSQVYGFANTQTIRAVGTGVVAIACSREALESNHPPSMLPKEA